VEIVADLSTAVPTVHEYGDVITVGYLFGVLD
jgi:hypothetical protein